jgi:hypothetical protein
LVKGCSCESGGVSADEKKNSIGQEVKKLLSEGVYFQRKLHDGRTVLDLIPDGKHGGGEGTRYLLTAARERDVIMTQLEEGPSKEGVLLEEGRYLMQYHCLPEDGVSPDIHHELNLYPESSERYYKLQYMRPPKKGYREYYCYPGPGSPHFMI